MLAIASRDEFFAEVRQKALEAREGEPLENTRNVNKHGPVAVIPVHGPLFRHASLFSAISGAASYEDLRKDLQAALDDKSVRAILLDVNSPGGEVDGCNELADFIHDARGTKPIWSYVGGLGASAACWLMTASDRIVIAETGMAGSIGVRSALVDDAKAEEQRGLRTVHIISSQSPAKRDKPIDDDVVARAQAKADELAAIFIGRVAKYRGVTPERVIAKFGGGDVLIGQSAVEAGLVDAIGTFEGALAELTESVTEKPTSARMFAAKAKTPTTASVKAPKRLGDIAMSIKHRNYRAEDSKPADKAEDDMPAAEDQCMKCGGDGKIADGSKCAQCDGSGKVKAKAEDEKPEEKAEDMPADDKAEGEDKPADAEDQAPEEKAEDEKEKEGESAEDDEKDGEKAAHRALAKLAGLPAAASLSRIAAKLTTSTVGASALAEVEKQNAKLEQRLNAILKREAQVAADKHIDVLVADGRAHESKRSVLAAMFVKAELAKEGAGPKALEEHLFEKGTFTTKPRVMQRITDGNGNPIGKKVEVTNLAADDGGDRSELERKIDARVREIQKAEKCTYVEAQRMLATKAPELHAAYKAMTALPRG